MGRAVPAAAMLVVGVVALAAARSAMLPGVAYWDTAELQVVGPLMGTGHPAGFPTWVLLGWFASVVLQPFGEPAFRMNLLAGLCLAVAAAITVDLVRALTRSTVLGLATAMGLAFTPIAWSIGTHAETHALHLLFVALLLRLLVAWEDRTRQAPGDRYLVAAAVVFG
ncbi:MAG: protein O-mannosyl-transferase family, partial [Candidatus Limnocylindrales bacterium]